VEEHTTSHLINVSPKIPITVFVTACICTCAGRSRKTLAEVVESLFNLHLCTKYTNIASL